MASNILYICQNALGDIVTTLPSIHFLKQSHPNSTLDVFVNEDFADIFAADPNVDRVIPAPAKWFDADHGDHPTPDVEEVRGFRNSYEVVLDSMCVRQTARLVELLRPGKAIGIGFAESVHAYDLPLSLNQRRTWSVGDRTAVDCFGDLVQMLNQDFEGGNPILHVSQEAQREGKAWVDSRNRAGGLVVAFNPGAGHPMKRWPMNYFLNVARALEQDGVAPLFIFGPKETELYSAYGDQIEEMGRFIYRSDTSQIQSLAGILCNCALLLTNDCAVMHIAAAVGCRVLAIFGPSNSRIWFPYSTPWSQVIERDVVCRHECRNGCDLFPCLTEISPEEVLVRLRAMLSVQKTLVRPHCTL
jgi:ADP-heptose:LPS heptosyltransferase